MAPPHRFTRASDGTALAYRVVGDGPALVFTNGYATSDFYWRNLARHFQDRATIVTWDLKGHGRSAGACDPERVTIEDSVDDLRRVLDAAGIDRATMIGFSLGCQIIFEAWRQIPDRIDAIIPILGTYGRPFDNLLHPRLGPHLHKVFATIAPPVAPLIIAGTFLSLRTPLAHRINQLTGMMGKELDRDTMRPFYDHFALIEPRTWVGMGIAAQRHTARDVLPTIDVPTLIVAGGRDALTPVGLSHEMHETIPTAELVMLPEATHAGLFEYPQEITAAVDDFLERHALLRRAEERGGRRDHLRLVAHS